MSLAVHAYDRAKRFVDDIGAGASRMVRRQSDSADAGYEGSSRRFFNDVGLYDSSDPASVLNGIGFHGPVINRQGSLRRSVSYGYGGRRQSLKMQWSSRATGAEVAQFSQRSRYAGAQLHHLGYGEVYDTFSSPVKNAIAREAKMVHGLKATGRKVPWAGAIFGRPMAGLGFVESNLGGHSFQTNMKWGIPLSALSVAMADRGKMAQSAAEQVGDLAGQSIGGAVGGFLGGIAGEMAGMFVGGEIGKRVGEIIDPLERLGRQGYHSNFGGGFQDNEMAATMRQRAVMEMGQSALNARRYLGQEAALMHQ